MNAQTQIVAAPPSVASAIARQQAEADLREAEKAFRTYAKECGADPRETYNTLADLKDTAAELVQLARTFGKRMDGTLAGEPFTIWDAAERMAEPLSEGLTQDAAAVLMAAVRKELA